MSASQGFQQVRRPRPVSLQRGCPYHRLTHRGVRVARHRIESVGGCQSAVHLTGQREGLDLAGQRLRPDALEPDSGSRGFGGGQWQPPGQQAGRRSQVQLTSERVLARVGGQAGCQRQVVLAQVIGPREVLSAVALGRALAQRTEYLDGIMAPLCIEQPARHGLTQQFVAEDGRAGLGLQLQQPYLDAGANGVSDLVGIPAEGRRQQVDLQAPADGRGAFDHTSLRRRERGDPRPSAGLQARGYPRPSGAQRPA